MHPLEDCAAFLISFLLYLPYHLAENTTKSDGKSGIIHRGSEDLARWGFFLMSVQQIISTGGPGSPGYIFTWCPGLMQLLHGNTEHSTPGGRLFTRVVAWSLPSRFFMAMLPPSLCCLLPYPLPFPFTPSSPSDAPAPGSSASSTQPSAHLQGCSLCSHIS